MVKISQVNVFVSVFLIAGCIHQVLQELCLLLNFFNFGGKALGDPCLVYEFMLLMVYSSHDDPFLGINVIPIQEYNTKLFRKAVRLR